MATYKIAFAVPGRFDAFDFAHALLARGHDVTILTNYPAWAVARFGIPPNRVRSFWAHGVASRVIHKYQRTPDSHWGEAALHTMYGRWAAGVISREKWDMVFAWSGAAEEILQSCNARNIPCVVTRGSAHIRTQHTLLAEEEKRIGLKIDKPTPWMIAREEREYQTAGLIRVLSSFALRSFVTEGIHQDRLWLNPPTADTSIFRPSAEAIQARQQRILSGAPLRVLFVGALSYQKGAWDLARVVNLVDNKHFSFRVVGPIANECLPLVSTLQNRIDFIPKQPQNDLPHQYGWGDIFLFPTIQDGFAVVLAQAQVAGLPIVATQNSGAPDIIVENLNGWVVPIRSPELIIERLNWCDEHRSELADMVEYAYQTYQPRTWDDCASEAEQMIALVK